MFNTKSKRLIIDKGIFFLEKASHDAKIEQLASKEQCACALWIERVYCSITSLKMYRSSPLILSKSSIHKIPFCVINNAPFCIIFPFVVKN